MRKPIVVIACAGMLLGGTAGGDVARGAPPDKGKAAGAAAGHGGGAPEGKGRGAKESGDSHGGHGTDRRGGHAGKSASLFSAGDRDLIRSWFADPGHVQGLPPGLAKRERLPPGLEKQLQRNGTLPPGLEKKLHPLPDDLARRLPPVPHGIRRVILGEHVLLLDERSSAIVDVLFGVARLAGTF